MAAHGVFTTGPALPGATARFRPILLVGFGFGVLLATGAGCWLTQVARDLIAPARGPLLERPADVLVLACALAGVVILARWLLGIVFGVLALTPGAVGVAARRGQRLVAPRVLVRMTSAVLGGTAVVVVPGLSAAAAPPVRTAPALTAPAWPADATGTFREPAPRPSYLPDPAWRAEATASRRPPPADRADPGEGGAAPRDPVLVAAGDTLWDLAAHRLPPGSPTAAIDRSWRAWYAANRRVVGPDPDLIRPGQRLLPPRVEEKS